MVPKRKSEEQGDHAIGMGDSKKKKPKGPGIALVIAIGHKGKHDKDAMKKAWSVLKGGFSELDMVLREEGPDAALAWLAERGVTGKEAMRILTPPSQHPIGFVPHQLHGLQHLREGAAAHEAEMADRKKFDQEGAPPPPPQLPDYDSGFAGDYDPDAKEKDAGFR